MKSKRNAKSKQIRARDKKVTSPSLTREYEMVFDHAKGMYIWDADNNKYLDFCASIAVSNVGHANPEVLSAVKKQITKGMHVGFADFYAELPVTFLETLFTLTSKKYNTGFLSNSGTEAVEAAYKCARWHTNKKWTIAFEKAFHGRTMGSLSMTNSQKVQRERFAPFLPVKHTPFAYCYRCKFGKAFGDCSYECLEAMEKKMRSVKNNLASVFVEPVQGEGGYIVPPKKFIQGLRKLCNEYNTLLCSDEVQSGAFRTGKFLAMEHFNVTADIVALSKAVGGGVPLGVTIANRKVMNWKPGSHANTFGGNLLACAGGLATLNYMTKKKLGKNAEKIGKYMIKELNELKEEHECIGDVRGLGLMIGVEIVKDKKSKKTDKEERSRILCRAYDNGLLLLPAGESVIRFAPPLIITKEQADRGLKIFEKSLLSKN
ncbi:MAG: aminotransferase class III-fold pyridoxal phosphate-dependent enzyme [Candidatus Diapherotrites archaeon]